MTPDAAPARTQAPAALHLETDASLNMRRPQEQPDGSNRHFAGGGIVVRTEAMELLHRATVPLGFVRSIDEAEALAVLEGLRIVRGMGAAGVAVRTDCLRVIEHVEDGHGEPREELRALGQRLRAEVATFRLDLRSTPPLLLVPAREGRAISGGAAPRRVGQPPTTGRRREACPRALTHPGRTGP